jgi:hypothetical protein
MNYWPILLAVLVVSSGSSLLIAGDRSKVPFFRRASIPFGLTSIALGFLVIGFAFCGVQSKYFNLLSWLTFVVIGVRFAAKIFVMIDAWRNRDGADQNRTLPDSR